MSNPPSNTAEDSGSKERMEPYIPSSQSLPEITVKGVFLGVILSILLAGANAYLGLLAGMTVSASIPAAVISMALLKMFRRSNILENNCVQTAASAGESLAAGVIFTFPALIIMGVWTEFNYWQTTVIAALGGLIGVLFTIPLRRALVVESPLKFPEGLATAEVLKVGDQGGGGVKSLAAGGVIGALFKFGESGLGLWAQVVEGAARVGNSILYFGSNLLPSLVAVGYIVGINIAVLIFLGGALNWLLAIPIYAAMNPWPADTEAVDYAWQIWSTKTRYLGVGAMVVGGLWALLRMGKSLVAGVTSGMEAFRASRNGESDLVERTDRDTPMPWVMAALCVSVVPLFFVFQSITHSVGVSLFMAVIMLIAGFLFSAVASYMAGMVGSSNNPISGVTIATLLTASLLLLFLLGDNSPVGPAAAILIGAVVCCAAAIGGDNMQDLKAGYLLGATPRNQQMMQALGVVAAAFAIAPVLTLLLKAYGIVDPVSPDRPALSAPQATLMASVAQGVFARNLPWGIVGAGMGVAVGIILLDLYLERRNSEFRTPVLAVAVGIYLPFELETAILAGGVISWMAHLFYMKRSDEVTGELKMSLRQSRKIGERKGLLFAAGLITGEAILGILLAIPIVLFKGENPMSLAGANSVFPLSWPGVLLLIGVMIALLRMITGPAQESNGAKDV